MGVASGCGEQEVGVDSGSGWNLWVWLLGMVVRRYIEEEEGEIAIFYFTRCVRKIALYSDLIHAFDWKSAVEYDGGV